MKTISHPDRFISQRAIILLTIVIVAVMLGFIVFLLGSLHSDPRETLAHLFYAGGVMVMFVAFLLAVEGVRWWWKKHKAKKTELR